MSTTLRVLFVLLLSVSASPLMAGSADGDYADRATVITAAIAGDGVRFTSASTTVQMRIRVFSGTALLSDSGWKDGNVFDWTVGDGAPLADGSYRCVVASKNLEGDVAQREATVVALGGRLAVELARETVPDAEEPKLTALTHDGNDGGIVSTAGDLTFRFGNYLSGKDTSRMRLTREGSLGIGTDEPKATLDVNGLIRAGKGIVFEDGTILSSGGGDAVRRSGLHLQYIDDLTPHGRTPAVLPLGRASRLGKASAAFAPAYQFVVNDTGVSVGTTNPDYRLDVTGTIDTSSGYKAGGYEFITSALQQGGSTIIGKSAGPSSTGSSNTFLGTQAGWYNTTGNINTFVGYQAGGSNVTNAYNAFFGAFAGVFATADDDTFVGALAGFNNTTGNRNTGIGSSALYSNQTSTENTAVGYHALYASTHGNNVAVGSLALAGTTTGFGNIAIGRGAGGNVTTGNYNIHIDNIGLNESNTIRIGQSTWHSRAFIAGVANTTPANNGVPVVVDYLGQLGVASSSRRYKFDIVDMDQRTDHLMSLRPVTFRYLGHGDTASLQYGLIAEEVAEIYPELVTRNEKGEPEAVMYQFLAPMLLNEVQKQQRTIDEQQKTIEALAGRLEALAQQVEEFQRTSRQH